jgi:hypothetical protein
MMLNREKEKYFQEISCFPALNLRINLTIKYSTKIHLSILCTFLSLRIKDLVKILTTESVKPLKVYKNPRKNLNKPFRQHTKVIKKAEPEITPSNLKNLHGTRINTKDMLTKRMTKTRMTQSG